MSGNLKITILVDNIAGENLTAEHGLALWVEAGTERIVFDTGQGAALAGNARELGIGLDQTGVLILSHGHYDHTGGIAQVTRDAGRTDVYCHPGVVQPRYSIRNGTPKPIQMPRESMSAMDRLPAYRLHWVLKPVSLCEEVGITGPIAREMSYEDVGGPFYLDREGKRPDPIEDDLALWVRTDDGLVVCVGCCHAGLVNTLNHILRLNPDSRIRAIIGGFHLVEASNRRLDQTIAALRSLEPDVVVPCHCTGQRAVTALSDGLGKRVSPGAAGKTYRF
jgi:7,8-dihydropterin-6-yl-methyl-4-(beta-D-ribofuranosyl)aminobenzene 5'-phosphate synthase